MGKKTKLGKHRKDVFYHRAKESGYRARAAYKLIQLNKKFNFLQASRVCIDLCAAPGSWMQVASKFMPISSVIIGVDRYAINPIPNTISIQGDITTEKVRQDLKSNLKTWKADLVLHDGAPNVGQNWMQDAYQQNLLVLHSFKLACEFLQKGGTFVSKVFRSKDHLSLQYVFRKLFKKVEATKPIASRFESAEIFVVCQGFLAPDKVDPQFFDPKYVFQTLESEPRNIINLLKPEKTKRKAEGYEEGATLLFKKKKISEFIHSSKYEEMLAEANEFEWDMPAARESVHTTNDIIELFKDIKVLNRKDLRTLLNWRKAVKAEIEEEQQKLKKKEKLEVAKEKDEVDEELEELEKIQDEVVKLQAEQKREEKQHRKKVEKKRKRQEEKMKLLLTIPGDPGPQETGGTGLFSLESLNKIDTLDKIIDQGTDLLLDGSSDEEVVQPKKKKYEYFSRDDDVNLQRAKEFGGEDVLDSEDEEESSDDEGLNIDKEEKKSKKKVSFAENVSYNDDDSEPDDDTGKTNPILTDLVGDNLADRRERKAEKWFSKNAFEGIEDDNIEDYEIEAAIKKHEEEGGIILKKKIDALTEKVIPEEQESPENRKSEQNFKVKDGPDSDSDLDSDSDDNNDGNALDSGVDSEEEKDELKDSERLKKKKKKAPVLSNFGLALATKMIRSKKAERDLCDAGWNRYMWGEEDLPDWFAEDERKNNISKLEVDREDLNMYENENKAVDARTIKKVVEAKARKQRRMKKRMARARKKAEVISEDPDMTAREKAIEMNKIYKKASAFAKPKGKKYIVMKKCFGGSKPKGQKGPTKMVDRRLKKDKRAKERLQLKKQGKKRKSKR